MKVKMKNWTCECMHCIAEGASADHVVDGELHDCLAPGALAMVTNACWHRPSFGDSRHVMMASLNNALVRDVHMLLDGSGATAFGQVVGRVDCTRNFDEANDFL